jgi:hypothetical protein
MPIAARIMDGNVRCGTRGCEGQVGHLVCNRLNPNPGWHYEGGLRRRQRNDRRHSRRRSG